MRKERIVKLPIGQANVLIKKCRPAKAKGCKMLKGWNAMPSYAPPSMRQRFPRAKNGTVTLSVYFDVSPYVLQSLGLGPSKALGFSTSYVFHNVDLNSTLEATRDDGHLFAKSVLASHIGN